MINRNFFFDTVRSRLFNGSLTAAQVAGLTTILNEWETAHSHRDDRWLAYMLATAHHETDRKMQPINEYGKGKNRRYGKRVKLSGKSYTDTANIFYGRGFVQLTWYENYAKAVAKLGVDLIQHAEKALDLQIATKIMFAGMIEGWFTGRKLPQYFAGATENRVSARAIINGNDKANLIADYGKKYYSAISYTV